MSRRQAESELRVAGLCVVSGVVFYVYLVSISSISTRIKSPSPEAGAGAGTSNYVCTVHKYNDGMDGNRIVNGFFVVAGQMGIFIDSSRFFVAPLVEYYMGNVQM